MDGSLPTLLNLSYDKKAYNLKFSYLVPQTETAECSIFHRMFPIARDFTIDDAANGFENAADDHDCGFDDQAIAIETCNKNKE